MMPPNRRLHSLLQIAITSRVGKDIQSYHSITSWRYRVVSFGFAHSLPHLPAGEVGFFAWHDATRVADIEEDESNEHRKRVEAVLVSFMVGDRAV